MVSASMQNLTSICCFGLQDQISPPQPYGSKIGICCWPLAAGCRARPAREAATREAAMMNRTAGFRTTTSLH